MTQGLGKKGYAIVKKKSDADFTYNLIRDLYVSIPYSSPYHPYSEKNYRVKVDGINDENFDEKKHCSYAVNKFKSKKMKAKIRFTFSIDSIASFRLAKRIGKNCSYESDFSSIRLSHPATGFQEVFRANGVFEKAQTHPFNLNLEKKIKEAKSVNKAGHLKSQINESLSQKEYIKSSIKILMEEMPTCSEILN